MPNDLKAYKAMLFDHKTQTRTDYNTEDLFSNSKPYVTDYKEKPPAIRPPYQPLKCLETLYEYKVANIPFSLYHKPKEIVRTNPRHVQKEYEKGVSDAAPPAYKTRPRIFLTPGVILDDLKEPAREMLISNIYKSSAAAALEDVLARVSEKNVRAPLPKVYAPPKPLKITRYVPPYVSPEWRMQSVTWEQRALRSHTDPTELFWLSRTPKCKVLGHNTERSAKENAT